MMNVSCKELRKRAWDRLSDGRYGTSLGVSVVGDIAGPILGVFTMGAVSYGVTDYYVLQQRGENPSFETMFGGFNKYGATLLSCLLQTVFLALWSMLFCIPGIIKSYSYSMMYYVMRDFGLSGTDAITKSRELMNGYKWKLFKLQFSFIGWYLLSVCTCGIGAILIMPYVSAANAEFYAELLKCHDINIGGASEESSEEIPTVEGTIL